MFKAIQYVIQENLSNLYRTYTISRSELMGDMRDTRWGIFWNFAQPAIQMLAYWLFFGVALERKPLTVDGIEVDFLSWMIVGCAAWNFVQPCLVNGCSSIYGKKNYITKMKLPVSTFPAVTICKELFNHACMMAVVFAIIVSRGHTPTLWWLQLLYYCFAIFCFSEAVALNLSVLTMLWRDIKKFVVSFTRIMFYFTPVVWECVLRNSLPNSELWNALLKLNPAYYVVTGYRDSVFYGIPFWQHVHLTPYFWGVTLLLFVTGCLLMRKFRTHFIDLL